MTTVPGVGSLAGLSTVLGVGSTGGGGGSSTIPLSFNDALFTGMTEFPNQPGVLGISAGQTRTRNSVVTSAAYGDQAFQFNGNNGTLSFSRCQAREGIRITDDNNSVLIDTCYIEAVGSGSDHADGLQGFDGAPGGSGTITIRNTHIALGGAANAAYFIGDGWRGHHVIENVIMRALPGIGAGGKGLKIDNSPIDLSVDGLYFIGSFPIGNLDLLLASSKIILWQNVYGGCSIVSGSLVLGSPIPHP